MICPDCHDPIALTATSCECGWTAQLPVTQTPKKPPKPPWQWFECVHCRYRFAYRSDVPPEPGRHCHKCRDNAQWYAEHAKEPEPLWKPVGLPFTPADDPIAEPDYFPRMIYEYARKHRCLVTEAAVLLAPQWLVDHAADEHECARVRQYLSNIRVVREAVSRSHAGDPWQPL